MIIFGGYDVYIPRDNAIGFLFTLCATHYTHLPDLILTKRSTLITI